MLHIDIICVGKLKETYLKEAVSEYTKRLSKYCALHIIELTDEPLPSKISDAIELQIKEKEGASILRSMKKDSYVFALDLAGKSYSSEGFSEKLEQVSMRFQSYYIYYWWFLRLVFFCFATL